MPLQQLTDYYAGPFAVMLLLTMLGASEMGYRAGLTRTIDEKSFSMLGVLQGAMLGTLALLLGFTFSLSASRYELRRDLMVKESTAIGTTYLRTTLLAPESGAEMRRLLKAYLEQRLERVDLPVEDPRYGELSRKTLRTQVQMWRIASAEGAKNRDDITALFIDSLNNTIDISQEQFAARKNRVPLSDVMLLSLGSIVSAMTLGYGFGICRRRLFEASLIFCSLVALVIFTIIDFDRPNRGWIRVPDEMLRNLHTEMSNALEREHKGTGLIKP